MRATPRSGSTRSGSRSPPSSLQSVNATTLTHVCSYAGSPSDATCSYTQTLAHGDDGRALTTAISEGTGAYEGWTYISHSTGVDPYMQGTVEGFVFPGDPPPMR